MSDWTTDAADRIEHVVGTVRDRTVVPAQAIAKALVFGLLAAFFVLTLAVLAVIMLFRALNYIPGGAWVAWTILGGIFVAGGTFCWVKRTS